METTLMPIANSAANPDTGTGGILAQTPSRQ
jgi:hypothetical protein